MGHGRTLLRVLVTLSVIPLFSQPRADSPDTCRVEVRKVVRSVYGSGYVRSASQVVVRSSVGGIVKEILVREGDRVRKGQMIAVVESGGLEERVKEVEERIRRLKEKLKDSSAFRRILDLKVSVAEEDLRKAEARYKRRLRLFKKGVIPKEALEEAERVYRKALRGYEIALKEREERIKDLEHELRSLKRLRDALKEELERYRIRSPIDGLVLRVFVEEGDTVNPVGGRDRVATVGSEEREVVLLIDEELAPLVRKGQEVYLELEALRGRVLKGEVVSRDLESDPGRRVVRVFVRADVPESVPVNSLAEGNIVVDILKTTVVPREAVKDGKVVLILNGERRKVKVGRIFSEYAEVIGYPEGTPCEVP
ncbi:MAG: biotin/lipoyl-binding protein [Aquificota bacterium]|nr:biotin/lipoyl-binding protein [Aquificota bacterium]